MEENFRYFVNNDCLICEDSHLLTELVEKCDSEIIRFKQKYFYLPRIFLNQRQPVHFLAGFIAASRANCPVFLCNPDWGETEWLQVLNLVKPDIIWGTEINIYNSPLPIPNYQFPVINSQLSHIMIPTGGSSGKIKFAVHTWDTLTASVKGFQRYFQVDKINSFCVLPLYHVSGLMQFMRCFISGGKLIILPFKQLELVQENNINVNVNNFNLKYVLNPLPSRIPMKNYQKEKILNGFPLDSGRIDLESKSLSQFQTSCLDSKQNNLKLINITSIISKIDFFISLVPTQIQRLLQKSNLTKWLSQFQTVLLGGAPAWEELLEKARYHQIRLAPTYGMTETASQIVTMKPEDFLRGKTGCGQVLPHAEVRIYNETGDDLKVNQVGIINIKAESLALGYYPLNGKKQTDLQIDDLAALDEQGYLNIVGRNSNKIISGGENVYPKEVEDAIRATGMVADICVIGLADKHWGQIVTAVYVVKTKNILKNNFLNREIQVLLKDKLSNYKIPKVWIPVNSLPRNSQGKINRQKLHEIALEYA